jgi:hypothetical protein
MEETIFDPRAAMPDRRRCERLELDGGVLYVKEMTAADTMFCLQNATRAGAPAHMALDMGGLTLWQVIVSCYRGPEPEAVRIFEARDMPVIQKLRAEEWNRLREVINRVNGLADEEVAATRDFTAPPGDASPASLPSFVSNNSAGSPTS